MIITRSPLRLSIGGGGTDLPSYYEQNGGFLIAMALAKHVYISMQQKFDPGITLKYSKIENVGAIDDIRHPIIREALKLVGVADADFEITSVADVPAGTGLGSSGSFTTALLKALHIYCKRHIDVRELAEMACHIEMNLLKEPIGKQDQYIAAYGGLTAFSFDTSGHVEVESMPISDALVEDIEENTLLFFTQQTRDASNILKEQDDKSKTADSSMIDNLNRVKELGYRTRDAFLSGNLNVWGEIMLEHWEAKKQRSGGMSSPQIDEWYDLAIRNGAIGGKLVGAGGGGFLLFYAAEPRRVRQALRHAGLKELFVHLDVEGTKVVNR